MKGTEQFTKIIKQHLERIIDLVNKNMQVIIDRVNKINKEAA